MEDFTFLDFTANRGSKRLENHTISFYFGSTSAMTLNIEDSKVIRDKDLTHLRLRIDNLTGELALIFNKKMGLELKKNRDNYGVTICNKSLVTALHQYLHLPIEGKTYHVFAISEDKANSEDYATFKILKEIL